MEEIWKDIEGFEGLYKVSNLGRVASVHRYNRGRIFGDKIKQPSIDKRNRITMELNRYGKAYRFVLARLVAKAFIPNPDNLPQVNHKDEDKTNNCVDNLE